MIFNVEMSGDGLRLMQKSLYNSMNYDFIAHVIRDIFPVNSFTIIYDSETILKDTLSNSEHGIGAFLLHTERDSSESLTNGYFWEAGWNHPFFTPDSADLFISINYNPELNGNHYNNVALQLSSVLKSNGLIFLVNPGEWANELSSIFSLRYDLIKECKRYKLLLEENVFVYENI